MKRFIFIFVLAGTLLTGAKVWSANNLRVQSQELIEKNTAGLEIGIFLQNDDALASFVMPLEIRSQNGTSFITHMDLSVPAEGRVGQSGLMDFPTKTRHPTPLGSNSCSGPTSSTYQGGTNSDSDALSPDAIMWIGLRTSGGDLAPGVDNDTLPSFKLIVDVNDVRGCFDIDTCCVTAGNHLIGVKGDFSAAVFTFEIGQICIDQADVQEVSNGIRPEKFELAQNYPNPFNAGTVIPFTTDQYGHVNLNVYDILGRHVTTLVDKELDIGRYNVDWDGTNKDGRPVATGVYFYRIETVDNVQTRKMLLIK